MKFNKIIDIYEDKISGGRADGKTVEDIAKKHKVDVDFIKTQVKVGIEVEYEHSPNRDIAMEIALDHLDEIPDYYNRLLDMEKDAEDELNEDTGDGMKIIYDDFKGLVSIDWEAPDVADLLGGLQKIESIILKNKFVKVSSSAGKKIMKAIYPLMEKQYKVWEKGPNKYGRNLDSDYFELFEKILADNL
jgi:hypothetical protein